jgi:hypothetical protein
MSVEEDAMDDAKAVREVLPVVRREYEDVFDLAEDINEEDVIYVAKCKVCRSGHRDLAEEYWETKQRNSLAVVRFLADKGEVVSDKAVKNHMEEHYLVQQRKLMVRRYASRLKEYASLKGNRLKDIALCRGVLIKKLMEIDAASESLPLWEQVKTSDIVTKLVAGIMSCNESERKFNEDWKPARVVIEKLEQIVQVELEHAPDAAKPVLAKVVSTLFDGLEGVSTDK